MEQKKKKTGLVIAVIAFILIAAGAAVVFLTQKEGYRSLEVLESYGETTVYRDGKELEAYEGMKLRSGDYLTVWEDSYLRMRLDDDKYVYLEGQALMKLSALGSSKDSRTKIELELGTMVTEVENRLSDGASYEIHSPNTTMAIRGTTPVSEVRYQIPAGENQLTEKDILEYLVAVRTDAADADKADEVEGLMKTGIRARVSSYVQNGKVELMVFEREEDGDRAKLTASYVTVKKGSGMSTVVDNPVSPQVISLVEVDEDGKLTFADGEETDELTKDYKIKSKRNKAETIEELNEIVESYDVAPMENLDDVQLRLDLDELSIAGSADELQESFERAEKKSEGNIVPEPSATPTPVVQAGEDTEDAEPVTPPADDPEEEPEDNDWPGGIHGVLQYDEYNLLWDYFYEDGIDEPIGVWITGIEETGRMRNETVIVPAEVNHLPVLQIKADAFNGIGDIVEVVLPDTLQYIGEFAFNQCFDLERVIIPDSVTGLGDGAFSGCGSLKEVKLSASLEVIPYLAFSKCEELESLVIPYGVKLLDGASIRDCYNLKYVLIPGSVEEIGWSAFAEAEELCTYLGEQLTYDSVKSYNFDNGDVVYVHVNTELDRYGYGAEYILVEEGIRIIADTDSANPGYVYNGLEQSVMQKLGVADMEITVPGPCKFILPAGAEYAVFFEEDYYFPGSIADINFDMVELDWVSAEEYTVYDDAGFWTTVCARVPNGAGYTYYLTPRIRLAE